MLARLWSARILVLLFVCVLLVAPSTQAAAPSPQYGADRPMVIVWPRSSDPGTCDPALGATVSGGIEIEFNVYDTLLAYDGESTKIVPALAESYEANADATQYTFHLRKGVKFHDGGEFTAEDVEFVWERAMAAKGMPASYWDAVKSMDILDKYTIRMNMKYSFGPWPGLLAGSRGVYMGPSKASVKAHATADDPWAFKYFQDHENGTGPYVLSKWERDVRIEFTKFNDYWRGWEGKHADKHVYLIVKDDNTQRLMLEKGELDVMSPQNPTMVMEMKKNPDITIRSTPSFISFIMTMNVNKFPTDNKLVRQALAYAFDYESAQRDLYMGFGQLGGQGVIPKTMWPRLDDLQPKFTYDLAKAKDLLKQAGWEDRNNDGKLEDKDGKPFPTLSLIIMDLPIRRQTTELWMSGLKKLGITVTPQYTTWTVNAAEMGKPVKDKPAHLSGFQNWPSYIDPSDILRTYTCKESEGGLNWSGYCNPELDKLLDQALATSVQEERVKLYSQAVRILQEDVPVTVTAEEEFIQAFRPWVKNWQVNPGLQDVQIFYPTYIEGRPAQFDHLK